MPMSVKRRRMRREESRRERRRRVGEDDAELDAQGQEDGLDGKRGKGGEWD